jgi:hypothetical protein
MGNSKPLQDLIDSGELVPLQDLIDSGEANEKQSNDLLKKIADNTDPSNILSSTTPGAVDWNEYQSNIPSPNAPGVLDWEEYRNLDRDFFNSDEEYKEYLKNIGNSKPLQELIDSGELVPKGLTNILKQGVEAQMAVKNSMDRLSKTESDTYTSRNRGDSDGIYNNIHVDSISITIEGDDLKDPEQFAIEFKDIILREIEFDSRAGGM